MDTQIISFAPHTFRPMMMMMMTGQSDSPLVLQIFGHDDELLQMPKEVLAHQSVRFSPNTTYLQVMQAL